jgi:GTP-binding protein
MDSDALERDRGNTILAKNASVHYRGARVNIVDTPGHADFGGQVERVLGTVDGALLIVDAWEGPMAQTRFVTKKALALGLKIMVVINKIDRDGCEPQQALDKVFDLFCDLEASSEQLDFPHIFCSGRAGTCRLEMDQPDQDLIPMLDMILDRIPGPKGTPDEAPVFQIATVEYSEFLGRIASGRVHHGTIKTGQTLLQNHPHGPSTRVRIQKILVHEGVGHEAVDQAVAGEIVSLAGLPSFDIGDTLCDPDRPFEMPRTAVDPPTISQVFSVNDSPLAGQYGGKFLTGSHLADRLERAAIADPALHVEKADGASAFKVAGRGVLHLSILIENMRREGFEFTVGAPEVLMRRDEEGTLLEPVEKLIVEVPSDLAGGVIEAMGRRRGEMVDMVVTDNKTVVTFIVPARGLIGLRTVMLGLTQGYAVMQTLFEGWRPFAGEIRLRNTSSIIVKDPGVSAGYALWKLEDRGVFFIGPGVEVYEGMIIGESNRSDDIVVNATKGKQLTNMRSSGADAAMVLAPPRQMSLEDGIVFLKPDEKLEVTPQMLRLRKAVLDENDRKKSKREA